MTFIMIIWNKPGGISADNYTVNLPLGFRTNNLKAITVLLDFF